MSQADKIATESELSTQEAANLLNVSLPHLISLLEKGEIPFRKVGPHRRVVYKNIVDYKNDIDQRRREALDELAAFSQSHDIGY